MWVDASYIEGEAGLGYEIESIHGDRIVWGYDFIETCESSSHAEARAMLLALDQVEKFPNLKCLYLYSDSESIVDAVNSETNRDFSPLLDNIRDELGRYEFYNVQHQSRETNVFADELADRGHRRENAFFSRIDFKENRKH